MSQCSGGSCSTCSDDPDRLPPGMLRRYDLNGSTADGILVWAEIEDGRIADSSAEILAAAKGLTDGRVYAAVFGGPDLKELYPEIFGYGVDTLYHVRGADSYSPEAYSEAISQVAERVNPAAVLMSATPRGREVAPRVAVSLGAGLVADCVALEKEEDGILMRRPAFGGTLTADIRCTGFPQMATVRPGALPAPAASTGAGTAIYWQYSGVDAGGRSEEKSPKDNDIATARILLAIGAGVRDRSLIDVAEEIASSMDGAMVCCSRAVAERGWMPRSRLVGSSGRIVRPELYIAFGISGSVQHIAGMSGAGRVIAVNTDPDAPIHAHADLSLLADAGEVLKEMRSRLADRRESCGTPRSRPCRPRRLS